MTAGPVVWLVAAAALCAQNRTSSPDADARALVERGRAAVAPARAGAVRSLRFTGRVRIPQEGSAFDEGHVDIRILLPDQFLRVDTFGSAAKPSRDRAFFTRFLLGAMVYLVPQSRLTIRSTGESAFEDTAAVDVAGPSFTARLVFDYPSLTPLRLTYFPSGSVSTVMAFADRRTVDGVSLPFRVSTQTPQRVLEALLFDDVRVNPPLTKDDFRP